VAVGLAGGVVDHLHGGVPAALITAAVVGPTCAYPCMEAFGTRQGATVGVTAALALGLASFLNAGNGHPIWSGFACGLAFAGAAWMFVGFFVPAQEKFEVNPISLYRKDRAGSWVVALTAGVAFGVVYTVEAAEAG
jgi:hypothetical protein